MIVSQEKTSHLDPPTFCQNTLPLEYTKSILVFEIFIIWFNLHKIKPSKNLSKHLQNQHKYAHFSKVDEINYFWYPRLLFTNPYYLTLKEGEGLIIPRNWWHWVSSNEKTYSINFWTGKKISDKPKQIKYSHSIDFTPIMTEIVKIWNTENQKKSYVTAVDLFLDAEKENEYLITLDGYEGLNWNNSIKTILKKQVKPPLNLTKYDFNIWMCSKSHDTGLHYDDEDGILCVLKGSKNIILYPPSDSSNLYPYPLGGLSPPGAVAPRTPHRGEGGGGA